MQMPGDNRKSAVLPNRRLPVLAYHHVGKAKPGSWPLLTISPSEFEKQIKWLAGHGYRAIRPSDWLAYVRQEKFIPEKPVLLTFDDAYADLAEVALPLLERYGFLATIFVVTAFVGGTNEWDVASGYPERRLMGADEIRRWSARGVDFGTHTRTHPDLRTVSDEVLHHEVLGSREELEALIEVPVEAFAYPHGHYNERVVGSVGRSFRIGFTCDAGLNRRDTDLLCMRRVNAGSGYSWVGQATRTALGNAPRELATNVLARVWRFKGTA